MGEWAVSSPDSSSGSRCRGARPPPPPPPPRLFRESFGLGESTRILDLGSESGGNIHAVLDGTPVRPENTFIADINPRVLERGRERFGFVPVLVGQSGKLPFPDGYFDIVYCSSVIEHVTVPKEQVWTVRSGREFRERSLAHQREFAREIQRVGRQFFVQTPYRWFLVESHSWLPFVSWLPRRLQLPVLKTAAKFWPKSTNPDWYLLDRGELQSMFADAEIRDEKWLGLTKSIMAVKSEQAAGARS
jgi:SAM-dependent methyltransferase